MSKVNYNKLFRIAVNAFLCTFLAISICSLFLTVVSKRETDGAAEIFGYQMRIVTSDSMAKCEYTDVSAYKIKDIPIRSMIFVEAVPDDPIQADAWYRALKVGDVLTFRYVYTTQVTITHRITSITEKETGGFVIELAGDNKTSASNQMYQTIDTSIPNNTDYVIGKVTGQAYLFGLIMSFLMQPIGIVMIIIIPCVIIMVLEVIKIVRVFSSDKRKKEREEAEKIEKELEELRSKLAALENAKAEPQAEPETDAEPETVAEEQTVEREQAEQ